MAEFYVEQRLSGRQLWVVEAASKTEAIRRIQAGEGEAIDFSIDRRGGYTATRAEG